MVVDGEEKRLIGRFFMGGLGLLSAQSSPWGFIYQCLLHSHCYQLISLSLVLALYLTRVVYSLVLTNHRLRKAQDHCLPATHP